MLIKLWSNDCRKFVKLSWALLSFFSLSFIRSGIFSSTVSIIFSRICSTFGSSLRDLAMPRVLKRSVIEGRDAQLAMYLENKWIAEINFIASRYSRVPNKQTGRLLRNEKKIRLYVYSHLYFYSCLSNRLIYIGFLSSYFTYWPYKCFNPYF